MSTPRSFVLACAVALLCPSFVSADAWTYDLGVANTDITFSKGTLIAGDTVRIYGRVTSWGTKDISGYVTFYQGEQLVGNSQVVTVRPNASYDDVWVDFVVPKGSFNIRAEIKGSSPQDENPANDIALSPMFTPLADTDGDLIADTQDNCVNIANADQKDADADGKGDVCDPYPQDATNTPPAPVVVSPPVSTQPPASTGAGSPSAPPASSLQPAAPKTTPVAAAPKNTPKTTNPVVVSTPETTEQLAEALAQGTGTAGIDGAVAGSSTTLPVVAEGAGETIGVSGETSVNAVAVETKRLAWDTYRFHVVGIDASQGVIAWQTSDGATGTGDVFTHVFHGSGTYTVHVVVTTTQGATVEGPTLRIDISFFNLGNWKLWLVLLGGLCVVGGIVSFLMRRAAAERE